jgi:hypothetical protein
VGFEALAGRGKYSSVNCDFVPTAKPAHPQVPLRGNIGETLLVA